jgi:hypothetical protein
MSDDEFAAGGDGQTAGAGADRDKRAPRFSWTPAYETTFFRSLCESVQLGLRENHSFKAEAWDRAKTALRDRHGAYPTKNHLVNKSDNARKKFRLWRGLREDPEFLYNPHNKTVTATEDAWKVHIEVCSAVLGSDGTIRHGELLTLAGMGRKNRCLEHCGGVRLSTRNSWRFCIRMWSARGEPRSAS